MANYNCTQKTNDFKVTDEKAYQELISLLSCEDTIENDCDIDEETGEKTFWFGAYNSIDYIDENEENNFDAWLEKLQPLLADDSAFILIDIGNEKLRSVDGYVAIMTKNDIKYMSLSTYAENMAKEMLGKKE